MKSLSYDRIDETAIDMMDCDSKVGVLATEDESGYPHLSFISSIQALGDHALTFGQFSAGRALQLDRLARGLNRFRRAWNRVETVIVQEPWWTAPARMADIVLPATTTLERNDIGSSSSDRFVRAMHRAVPPSTATISASTLRPPATSIRTRSCSATAIT